jgi:hypothetical protein
MKLGMFVMGGIAGAALAIYMQRNRYKFAAAGNWGQSLMGSMNSMKEGAVQSALNMKFGSGKTRSPQTSSMSAGSGNDLNEVQKLASQDPHLKQEINSILQQNGQHQI